MKRLFYNGNILRADGGYARALLTENGRITAVLDEVPNVTAERVDLGGGVLLPAFLDAHSHLSGNAAALLQIPLEDCVDFGEIRAAVEKFIRDTAPPPGEWIIAKGYDHNCLTEQRHPDISLLDRAAPDNPLALQHASGHMGVFNTPALRILGITPATPDPEGGRIGRSNGQPNGYMEENAFVSYVRKIPMPDANALCEAFTRAQRLYASNGIVTAQEGMAVRELVPLYRLFSERALIRLDVVAYADYKDFDAVADGLRGCENVRVGGCKLFLDGSPQGRTAWMRTPYAGSDADCGYGTMSFKALTDALRFAYDRKIQPLAHCNGDAAAAQYIEAVTRLKEEGKDLAPLRPVMIHAQLLDIDQLPAVKAAGIIPSFFVAHVYHWGDAHIRNFGSRRAARISPAASASRLGIPFTFHQDAPVIKPDMPETLWCACVRRTKDGAALGPEERITAERALEAVTVNAAYQYGEEKTKGVIERGKRADFVLLDRDPRKVPPETLRDITVLRTYKEGACIFEK